MNWVHFPAVFPYEFVCDIGKHVPHGFIWINASAGLIGPKLRRSDWSKAPLV